jgi:6-phosphogluconolactonase
MAKPVIISFTSSEELARAAAGEFVEWLSTTTAAATRTGRPVLIALSGGRITRLFFAEVARLAAPRRFPWPLVHFFWADERCVPPTDEESNFSIADKLIFRPLAIPAASIHRIRGEDEPSVAASAAATALLALSQKDADGTPQFDLVLLGMGEDGHVASLFPGGADAMASSVVVYLPVVASKPPPNRITLTYRVLFAAETVWVLASGKGKELAMVDGLSANGTSPLAHVMRNRQQARIFKDFALPEGAHAG